MWAAVVGWALLFGATETSTAATTSDEAAREAEMFGSTDEPAESPDRRALEAEMFGGSDSTQPLPAAEEAPSAADGASDGRRRRRGSVLPSDRRVTSEPSALASEAGVLRRMTERIEELDDTLVVGGTMWLQIQTTVIEDTNIEDSVLSSPNIVDVFLDGRPNDRLRGFVQGRLNYDPTAVEGDSGSVFAPGGPGTQVQLDQLWLRFDVYRTVFVTAGKQRIRWGSGRLWNPTDFLNQQRLNPISLFDIRLGVPLVKLHVPVEAWGWNFYAVANLDEADQLRRIGGAVRAELLLGNAELSLSVALRDGDAQRYGIDLTAPLWEFDLRFELGLLKGDRRLRLPAFVDSALTGLDEGVDPVQVAEDYVPLGENREADWIPQLMAGAEIAIQYSDQDSLILGVEYFFNDAGSPEEAYSRLLLAGRFNPLDAGRHYLGFFATLLAPGDWDDVSVFLSGIANLNDLSGVARADLSFQVLTFLSVRLFSNVFWGSGVFSLRVDLDPLQRLVIESGGAALPVLIERIPVPVDTVATTVDEFGFGAFGNALTAGLPIAQVGAALVIDL